MGKRNLDARFWLRMIIGVCVVTFLVAGGGLLFAVTGLGAPATPTIVFVPLPALDQLAAQYPEIANLLLDPTLGSAYKEFLVAFEQGGIPAAEALAQERGLLNKRRELQITLVLDSPDNATAVSAELQQMGITVDGTYDEFVDIAIPLALIEQAAKTENPGRVFAQLASHKHVVKIRLPATYRSDTVGMASEAVSTTGAEAWHKAGYTGKGVKIGVLDLGFDGYKALLGKTLPARVTAKSFVTGQEPDNADEDHGTLCAQIVYAMAPGADLYLAYYDRSSSQRAAVTWLLDQGVQIISHSAGGAGVPLDGTGSNAKFVDSVSAKGILWVNSAGNYGEGHYRATVSPKNDNQWIDFPGGSQTLKISTSLAEKYLRLVLQWNDWGGQAKEDYDLFLYDAQGNLMARSDDAQSGKPGDWPVEEIELNPPRQTTYWVKVLAKRTTRASIIDLFAYGGDLAYFTPEYSVASPADARSALSVGAILWRNNSLEPFSSRGPTYDGRIKPDLVAPDGVNTSNGSFFGTSAAAPHVSGAAALVWSRFPNMSATDVKAYLTTQSIDMGPSGMDNEYGSGRLQLPEDNLTAPTTQVVLPTVTRIAILPPPSATVVQPTWTPAVPLSSPSATVLPATLIAAAPLPPPPAQPTAQIIPRAPESSKSNQATLVLGLLMCGGIVGGLGSLTALFITTRQSLNPIPASLPPTPIIPRQPIPSPVIPRAPVPPVQPIQQMPMPPVGNPQAPARPPVAYPPMGGLLWLASPTGRLGPLQQGNNSLGRSPQNTFHLDAPQVSRQHAILVWNGMQCTVMDTGSSNGTFVNGRRLVSNVAEVLHSGDQVSFGGITIWTVVRQ